MMKSLFATLLGSSAGALPSLSPKEAIVLRLLHDGSEMYGLEIVGRSQGAIGRGTVYVTLARMEDKGFVTSRQEAQPEGAVGLPRRLYRIVAKGEEVLDANERAAMAYAGRTT